MEPQGELDDREAAAAILIVVGARLCAERVHRPLAYRMRERILKWQDEREDASSSLPPSVGNHKQEAQPAGAQPIVCSDLWYLNAPALMARPTIAIGDPGVNAASAFLANKLPVAFSIDQTLRVHLDPELIELRAALWGATPSATLSAVDLFCERYLRDFLEAAEEATK